MQVFESTAMVRIEDHTVYTHGGSITAGHIIIAVDKLEQSINPLADEIFHAQTFMSVSEPLPIKNSTSYFQVVNRCNAGIRNWFILTTA
jgi:hypothetical protein